MVRRLARRVGGFKPSRALTHAMVIAIAVLGLAGVVGGATAVSGCGAAVPESVTVVSESEVAAEHGLVGHPPAESSSKVATARGWAVDEEARLLLRRAMIAIEVAYVDLGTYDPGVMSPPVVAAIDESVTWVPLTDESAATAPTALAPAEQVNYSGTETTYAVGTISATGTAFGVIVDAEAGTTTYYVDGMVGDWNVVPATPETVTASGPDFEPDIEPGAERPSGRRSHSMAYSPATGTIVLFGGHDGENDLLDTWIYDPAADRWTALNPTGEAPGSSFGVSMVADAAGGRVLVLGALGFDGITVYSGVWAYDPVRNTWERSATEGEHPLECGFYQAALDAVGGRAIFLGGSDGMGRSFDDTWAYEFASGRWMKLDPQGDRPVPRKGYSMVCDSATGRLILFGGAAYDSNGVPYDTWAYDPNLDDTWAYDPAGNTWTELQRSGAVPQARSGHSMVYDPVSGKVILFGGMAKQCDGPMNDSWAYDPAANTWTELEPRGEIPVARSDHAMVYEPAGQRIILFGGTGLDGSNDRRWLDDTWAYDPASNTWTKLAGSEFTWTTEETQDGWAKHVVEMTMQHIKTRARDAGTFDPAVLTPAFLSERENIDFIPMADERAATAPTAYASSEAVNYWGTATMYAVGAKSTSGHTFGIVVDLRSSDGPTYYVDGEARLW